MGAVRAPLLPSQDSYAAPVDSGSRKALRTPRKGALVGAQQAPEVEAWRQIFLLIQPMELVDGFAVSHVPVQVTVPVDGDAHHPALTQTQLFKVWGFRMKELLPYRSASSLLKREHIFCLRRDTEKLPQDQGPVSLSGPTSPNHSSFLEQKFF